MSRFERSSFSAARLCVPYRKSCPFATSPGRHATTSPPPYCHKNPLCAHLCAFVHLTEEKNLTSLRSRHPTQHPKHPANTVTLTAKSNVTLTPATLCNGPTPS